MCIIVIKPINEPLPNEEIFKNCFINNPDGAGIMYTLNEKVIINKGLMSIKYFTDTLNKIKKIVNVDLVPMIFHFRIGTHGKNNQGNTHPFPISDEKEILQKINNITDIGLCHNGIIRLCDKTVNDMSDTMMFISDYITHFQKSNPEFHQDENILQIIDNMTDSKFAFLDKYSRISLVGKFDKVDGIYYSNSTYQNYYSIYKNYNFNFNTGTDSDYVRVMPLHFTDYAFNKDGKVLPNTHCNLYMDFDYNVYEYEPSWDVLYKKNDFIAVDKKGSAIKYSTDYEELLPVLVF